MCPLRATISSEREMQTGHKMSSCFKNPIRLFASPVGRGYEFSLSTRRAFATLSTRSMINHPEYVCDLDVEPLERYRPGGYYPVRIGDSLNQGRYSIVNKLGWGGWSTVWLSKDEKTQRYVAIKISTSELAEEPRETKVIQALAAAATTTKHPGSAYVSSAAAQFLLDGPNGIHNCAVYELMGPNVPDVVARKFGDERLPGRLAKRLAKQALLGLDFLHQLGIAHGDLHTRNLVFQGPSVEALEGKSILQGPREKNIASVRRRDGGPLDEHKPLYLVDSVSYPFDLASPSIQIIDFGEAFLANGPPSKLNTPLVVRAPEVVFGDALDLRVDLWSMGCMLFELVTGQPPFDSMFKKPSDLVNQWVDSIDDRFPERWKAAREVMGPCPASREPDSDLQEWLEELYFDEDRESDITREEISKVGNLVKRMLRFEPSERAPAKEILQDSWFEDVD